MERGLYFSSSGNTRSRRSGVSSVPAVSRSHRSSPWFRSWNVPSGLSTTPLPTRVSPTGAESEPLWISNPLYPDFIRDFCGGNASREANRRLSSRLCSSLRTHLGFGLCEKMFRITSVAISVRVLADHDTSVADHESTEIIASAGASPRICDGVIVEVEVGYWVRAKLVRPAPICILAVPMRVVSRIDGQGNIPALTRPKLPRKVRYLDEAVSRCGSSYARTRVDHCNSMGEARLGIRLSNLVIRIIVTVVARLDGRSIPSRGIVDRRVCRLRWTLSNRCPKQQCLGPRAECISGGTIKGAADPLDSCSGLWVSRRTQQPPLQAAISVEEACLGPSQIHDSLIDGQLRPTIKPARNGRDGKASIAVPASNVSRFERSPLRQTAYEVEQPGGFR